MNIGSGHRSRRVSRSGSIGAMVALASLLGLVVIIGAIVVAAGPQEPGFEPIVMAPLRW